MTPLFVIESGSVSGALLELSEKGTPKILFSQTEELPFSETVTEERLHLATIAALKRVLEAMIKSDAFLQRRTDLENTQVIIGAPWYTSFSRVVSQTYKKPEVFKESTLDEMMTSELKRFEEENKLDESAPILEKQATNILLNGYSTTLPFGKKTLEVEVSFYISIITGSFKKEVEDVLASHIVSEKVLWHSVPLVFFRALKSLVSEKDFLILEVGSELSELSLVKNGHLLNTVSLPLGSRKILREISPKLGVSEQLIPSMFLGGDNESAEKLKAIKSDLLSEWQSVFHKAISVISNSYIIPQTIFLMTADGIEPLVKNLLADDTYVNEIVAGPSLLISTIMSLNPQTLVAQGSVSASSLVLVSSLFISSFEQTTN